LFPDNVLEIFSEKVWEGSPRGENNTGKISLQILILLAIIGFSIILFSSFVGQYLILKVYISIGIF
jgi:hypothetical protein